MVIEEIKPTNYIGYHMGDIDDFYDNSSENDELNEIMKTANHLQMERGTEPQDYEAYVYENIYNYETNELRTIILGYGIKNDMWNLERDLHRKYNVSKEEKYFNDTKSGGAYKTIPVDDLENLKKNIKSGRYTKMDEENIVDLYKELIPERLQNRTDEDDKFVNDIRDDIMEERSTEICEPIRVKINKDGTRTMFDGNTTLMAAYRARKKVNTIKVDEIPYSISSNYTDDEFNELGVLLNERSKVRKRPCSKEDVAQTIYKRYINNSTPIKDVENRKYIKATGWNTSVIYSIVRAWINKGKMVGTYINYQLDHNNEKLKNKVKKYTDKLTGVLSMSSGSFKDDKFNSWLSENTNYGNRKPKKKYLYIVMYHPNERAEDKWIDKLMAEKQKEIKYLCGLTGVSFRGFRYMDTI